MLEETGGLEEQLMRYVIEQEILVNLPVTRGIF